MSKDVVFYTDAQDEAFVLGSRFDVAIPVYFYQSGECLRVECYPRVEKLVRAHVEAYRSQLFSDASLHALHKALAPRIKRWGYADDCHRMRRHVVYTAAPDAPLPQTGIKACRLTAEHQAKNKTTLPIDDMCARGCLVFGVLQNGYVVSLAATHEGGEAWGEQAEVVVETAVAARGNGFATASLIALRAALAQQGCGMEYRCSTRNTGSRRVAAGAGLALTGQCYYYVLRALRR